MKKRMFAIIMLVCTIAISIGASAEENGSLNDFANRLKKNASVETISATVEAAEDDVSFGPALRMEDPFFQKVRSSAYLRETEYSREANVMIELKNVSGRTLYPDEASITAYNAAGEVIDEETYSSYGPNMVKNGESLYIWDWFYGFDVPVAEISWFEVKLESETSSYTAYDQIAAQALVSDGIAYALVENTTENDIYGLDATIVVENDEKVLLDICDVNTGNSSGIFPGSIMILRARAEDYANDDPLMEGNATAIVLHELDN